MMSGNSPNPHRCSHEKPESNGNARKRRREAEHEDGSESDGSSLTSLSPSTFDTEESFGLAPTQPGLGLTSGFESQPRLVEFNIIIYVGSDMQVIPQSRFLHHIWHSGLDSPCMVCYRGFDVGKCQPPIRTVSFETSHNIDVDITRTPIVPYALRIFNRHLDCLKDKKIGYIPISHAWHSAVSTSQENRRETFEATRLAYQIPVKTLDGLYKKYGPVEIWHDYLSVPQWHEQFQKQLLLAIPDIYATPERIVMHLDDVKTKHLNAVQKPRTYRYYLEALSAVTKSRWFERMWVTLEYTLGREVFILSETFEVFSEPAGSLCLNIDDKNGDFINKYGLVQFGVDAARAGYRWYQTMSFLDTEKWKKKPKIYRTFGDAVYILGQKKCRDARDYFFALRALLNLPQTNDQVTNILSGDKFQSYLSIAWQALNNGDYTPLLLTPPSGEKSDDRAPWLRGYSKVGQHWNLGNCHERAKYQTIIRDGRITPEVEMVGVIEDFSFYDFSEPDNRLLFHHISSRIMKCSGTDPQQFGVAVDRVFPRTSRKGQYAVTTEGDPRAAASCPGITYDSERIGALLEKLDTMDEKGHWDRMELLRTTRELMDVLELEISEPETGTSRIQGARVEAEWYQLHPQDYKDMEGLAQIFCRSCGRRALYRLSVWDSLRPNSARAYRIPKLLYDLTVPDGVGLVVQDGLIIGRMDYGIPSCDCHKVLQVDLA